MTDDDMLTHYSAALDEIFRLRTALAYEAAVIEAHLGLVTFPKSRRDVAEGQVERMKAAASGNALVPYAGVASWALDSARERAGMGKLTRAMWEAAR
jgi:hypothetical protein